MDQRAEDQATAEGEAFAAGTLPEEDRRAESPSNEGAKSEDLPPHLVALQQQMEVDIPDFSKPEDFGSVDLAAPPAAYRASTRPLIVGAEGAESELELVELPFQENGGAGEAGGLLNTADLDVDDELEEDGPVSALLVAQHIEIAPTNITLPETCLPIGTEIVREAADIWHFKLPGRQTIVARGRTLYGAMVYAGIVR